MASASLNLLPEGQDVYTKFLVDIIDFQQNGTISCNKEVIDI